jgi:hypothetical protein
LLDFFSRAPKLGLHGFRAADEGRAHRRWANASGMALEQRYPQFVFDLPDTSRERRLRNSEMTSSGA